MRTWLLVAAVALTPHEQIVEDRVDVIEVNHLYDEGGELVLDQVIFWEWRPGDAAFRVVAWRLLKSPAQYPQRDLRRGGYVSTWRDGSLLRQVRAMSKRTTWTQHDPEVFDRQFVEPQDRRGLTGEKPPPADWRGRRFPAHSARP